ncbi:MAG: nucleotidyltransferase family protein [Chloroflexi bacterium]|nr:nucleotidyltransferase family protein [Chloroflexota bacterium]MBU1660266.1 nucleotidyltransferase family protein [Chloroflexota bacterium]
MSALHAPILSPEDRLLLLCARITLTPTQGRSLLQIIEGKLNWNRVLNRAVRQGIPTLVYYHLSGLDAWAAVPSQIWDTLERAYQAARLLTMRQRFEFVRLLDALRVADVQVIPLKGIALRGTVYPNLALRPSGDIDLLVRSIDIELTENVLRQLGYEPVETDHPKNWYRPENYHHLVPYVLPGRNVLVEIHWGLLPPDTNIRIGIEGIWQRSRVCQIAGCLVRLFCPEDMIIHLGMHAIAWQQDVSSQSLPRLRHLVDIAETARYYETQLDWNMIVDLAQEWDVQQYLFLVLRVTQSLLEAKGLDQPLATLQPLGFDDALVADTQRRVLRLSRLELPEPVTDNLIHFLLAESSGDKLRLLVRVIFPSRKRMGQLYHLNPESWRIFPCYLLRPFQLLSRHARILTYTCWQNLLHQRWKYSLNIKNASFRVKK